MLTGHGNFAASLRRFGLRRRESECESGLGEENAEHLIRVCKLETCVRGREEFIGRYGRGPPLANDGGGRDDKQFEKLGRERGPRA